MTEEPQKEMFAAGGEDRYGVLRDALAVRFLIDALLHVSGERP